MDQKASPLSLDGKSQSRFRQYLACVVVNMTSFAYGVAIGWPSPVIPLMQSGDNPVGDRPMSISSASWLGSLVNLGALVATPLYAVICERQSRKMVGYVVGLCGAVGWILTVVATSEAVLFSARFLIGVAASGSNIICSIYIAEVVDTDIRGSLGSLINMFMCGGVLFVYVVGSYASFIFLNVICLAIPVTFLTTFFWMPESPAYLASVRKPAEARRAREWLRLKEKLEAQDDDGPENNGGDHQDKKYFVKEVFTNRGVRKAAFIGLGLMANNQLNGVTAVLTYTVTIFQESGSELSPNVSAIIVGAVQLFGVYMASILMDRAGRRVLLICSNMSLALSLTTLGIFFHLKARGIDMTSFGWLPVTCLCVYVSTCAVGCGTVPFVIIGEIFPLDVKSTAISFCIFILNLFAFLVARFFLETVQVLGMDGCYWFFAAVCLAMAVFSFYLVPETKNKSLALILREMNG